MRAPFSALISAVDLSFLRYSPALFQSLVLLCLGYCRHSVMALSFAPHLPAHRALLQMESMLLGRISLTLNGTERFQDRCALGLHSVRISSTVVISLSHQQHDRAMILGNAE